MIKVSLEPQSPKFFGSQDERDLRQSMPSQIAQRRLDGLDPEPRQQENPRLAGLEPHPLLVPRVPQLQQDCPRWMPGLPSQALPANRGRFAGLFFYRSL